MQRVKQSRMAAGALYAIVRKRNVSMEVTISLHECIVVSTFVYGSETCTLSEREK